ncbi:MAG: hypothetical protein AAB403_00075, partial [Planctomycetota bacterium]
MSYDCPFHIRNYGFLSHTQRGKKLPLIRKLLGVPEPEVEAEGGGEPQLSQQVTRPCPACATGVLVELKWPRPSIAQIMR